MQKYKDYDGWVLKVGKYLRGFTFKDKRADVVKGFEDLMRDSWRKYRRKGAHKIVRVKLVEVGDE